MKEWITAVPIACPPRRMCWRCGNERGLVRVVNGYAGEPGEPRYLSVCGPGWGCRHTNERCKYGPGCGFTSHA